MAVKATAANTDDMTFGNFKVEIKRGPAPNSSKGLLGVGGAVAAARRLAHAKEEEKIQIQMRAAEEAAARAGKDTAAHKQALSVVSKLNAQMRASKLVLQSQLQAEESGLRKPSTTNQILQIFAQLSPSTIILKRHAGVLLTRRQWCKYVTLTFFLGLTVNAN
jgi:ATP-dependent RNA helicase DDX46/PRP5